MGIGRDCFGSGGVHDGYAAYGALDAEDEPMTPEDLKAEDEFLEVQAKAIRERLELLKKKGLPPGHVEEDR